MFAFANAGVPLSGVSIKTLFEPIPFGIGLGLFMGKQCGVFVFSWLAIKTGIAKMPDKANWKQLYGISILCGIGFTMSLFIGSLAFTGQGLKHSAMLRVGVLMGSLVSAVVGYLVLYRVTSQRKKSLFEK